MKADMDFSTHKRAFEAIYSSHPLLSAIRRGEVDEWGVAYKSPLHKLFWWWTFENIFALLRLRNEDRVLNVGIGFGFDEKVIKARLPGIKLWGVDISSSMIVGALLNSTPAALAVAAAEELPLPANAFTRIVSREVIEHVLDPVLFLRQINEVAAPRALVVITTPNGDSLALTHLLKRLRLGSNPRTNQSKDEHMTTKQLEQLFASCGFEIRHRFFDSAGYFWLSRLFSTPLRPFVPFLARAIRRLEGHYFLSRIMCDQVKYTLIYRKTAEDRTQLRTAEIAWVCPKCKGSLSWGQTTLKCSRCNAWYDLINGKAPVFLKDSYPASTTQQTGSVEERNILTRRFVWAAYSLVYGPVLLMAALISWVLGSFGRASKTVPR